MKSCYYQLFFSNQLHPPQGEENLNGNIKPLPELSFVEIDLNITQGEEKRSKNNVHANLCRWKSFFREAGLSVFDIHLKQDKDHSKSL